MIRQGYAKRGACLGMWHGVYGVKQAKTIEQFKAFSQNMMHESMEITDRLYGSLASDDLKNTISTLGVETIERNQNELFEMFIAFQDWMRDQDNAQS